MFSFIKKIYKNNIIFILLLFAFSLFSFYLYDTKNIEGLTTGTIIGQINIILADTTRDELTKLKTIQTLIYLIDDISDKKLFYDVLNDTTTTTSQKIKNINDIILSLNDRIKQQSIVNSQKQQSLNLQNNSEEASKNSPLRQYD